MTIFVAEISNGRYPPPIIFDPVRKLAAQTMPNGNHPFVWFLTTLGRKKQLPKKRQNVLLASLRKAPRNFSSFRSKKMFIFHFKNSLFEITKILHLPSPWAQNCPKKTNFLPVPKARPNCRRQFDDFLYIIKSLRGAPLAFRVLIFKSSIDFARLEACTVTHSSAMPPFRGPISVHFYFLRKKWRFSPAPKYQMGGTPLASFLTLFEN